MRGDWPAGLEKAKRFQMLVDRENGRGLGTVEADEHDLPRRHRGGVAPLRGQTSGSVPSASSA